MGKFIRICLFTLKDQARQKSLYALLAVSALFVMLLRGCYKGNYNVNGQSVDNLTVAWHASKIAFHIIGVAVLLAATLFSMRIFSRDAEDGSLVMILSRPARRFHYVLGRAAGVWLISSLFMFVLHLTIFLVCYANTGGIMPGYLTASLVMAPNLLFMALLVLLLSLVLPDVIAALSGVIISAVCFLSDMFFHIVNSDVVQSSLPKTLDMTPSLWRALLPKLGSLQFYAASLIGGDRFAVMGPVHPAVNVLLYCALLGVILILAFEKREI